jgi:protein-tyrosine phosphatase
MTHRQINWKTNLVHYKKMNIEPIRFSIEDFNRNDLAQKLIEAGNLLGQMVNKLFKVYVHCTAGMNRAAATVIAYLVLFNDFEITDAFDYVKSYRNIICPDVKAIQIGLQNYDRNINNRNLNRNLDRNLEENLNRNLNMDKDLNLNYNMEIN